MLSKICVSLPAVFLLNHYYKAFGAKFSPFAKPEYMGLGRGPASVQELVVMESYPPTWSQSTKQQYTLQLLGYSSSFDLLCALMWGLKAVDLCSLQTCGRSICPSSHSHPQTLPVCLIWWETMQNSVTLYMYLESPCIPALWPAPMHGSSVNLRIMYSGTKRAQFAPKLDIFVHFLIIPGFSHLQ